MYNYSFNHWNYSEVSFNEHICFLYAIFWNLDAIFNLMGFNNCKGLFKSDSSLLFKQKCGKHFIIIRIRINLITMIAPLDLFFPSLGKTICFYMIQSRKTNYKESYIFCLAHLLNFNCWEIIFSLKTRSLLTFPRQQNLVARNLVNMILQLKLPKLCLTRMKQNFPIPWISLRSLKISLRDVRQI